MADISMCLNKSCPIKDKCYRTTAIPNEFRQAYSEFNYNKETESCDYFYDDIWSGQLHANRSSPTNGNKK